MREIPALNSEEIMEIMDAFVRHNMFMCFFWSHLIHPSCQGNATASQVWPALAGLSVHLQHITTHCVCEESVVCIILFDSKLVSLSPPEESVVKLKGRQHSKAANPFNTEMEWKDRVGALSLRLWTRILRKAAVLQIWWQRPNLTKARCRKLTYVLVLNTFMLQACHNKMGQWKEGGEGEGGRWTLQGQGLAISS